MNILVLCGEVPYPPHGGSRMRAFQFLRGLSERHVLTLLAFQYADEEDASIEELRQVCHVETVRWHEPRQLSTITGHDGWSSRLSHARVLWLDREPFVAQYFRTTEMRTRVRELLARERFDLFHVEDTAMMTLLPRGLRIPIVLSIQNVESWREARAPSDGLIQKVELLKLRRYEHAIFKRAAVCCPTSELEAEQIRKLAPEACVNVIANGVDTQTFFPAGSKAARPTLVFSGTLSYAPNAEGIRWFARDIWPLIQAAVPDASLTIVGREPPEEIRVLASDHISVTGEVPDVRPYLREAWVAVVPILQGGGTRLKILEAMACALPVVSTTIGAEGLAVTDREDIVIADDPQAFVRQVVQLLNDQTLCVALGQRGRALVEQQYDWRTITARLENIYVSLKRTHVSFEL